MEQALIDIREQQKTSWNKFSPGWKKWNDLTMDFLKPYGDAIIQNLDLKEADNVLDVAAGTGEPGLTIASKVKNGKVMITDLADDMLVIAHENAEKRGLRNVEFSACDVCELPFADNTFDAVSCRFGFMFFPDMLLAAKEMRRVLKPGGRLAATVWNIPEKNFWVTAVMDAVKKNVDMPQPPPGSPGLFRCAKDGLVADLFLQAGLKNISQSEIAGTLNCKTTDVYWAFMSETPAPVATALGKADAAVREKIREEVYRAVNQKYPEGSVFVDANAWVIYGEK